MSQEIAQTMGRFWQTAARIQTVEPQQRPLAVLLSIPYLRAAWTMGCVAYVNPQVIDISGNQNHLTNNNVSLFGEVTAAPYTEFDGVNQYLSRADGGAGNWADILGTEAYVPAAQRGLTFGGWFQFDRLTNFEFLIGKSTGVAAASSYWLAFRGDLAGDPFVFSISNGVANTAVQITFSDAPTTGRWYYVVGRYDPGTEIKVFVGSGQPLETNTNVAAIPAALNDSATAFTIGSFGGGANYLDGKASCCYLCAGLLSDAWIECIYSQLRSVFRV